MMVARKVSMQGRVSSAEAKAHLEAELEDAAIEVEEQNGAPRLERRRRKGRARARGIVKRQDEAFKDSGTEGLWTFMLNYTLVFTFLIFPQSTNVVFTMLRKCRHIITPLPHGSHWMWNDYSIQVRFCEQLRFCVLLACDYTAAAVVAVGSSVTCPAVRQRGRGEVQGLPQAGVGLLFFVSDRSAVLLCVHVVRVL